MKLIDNICELNVVWFIKVVELCKKKVIFAKFVSVIVVFMNMKFCDRIELFDFVGWENEINGIIESTKNVIEEEFKLFAESLAYIVQVFEPCDDDREEMLFPQVIEVFVVPPFVVYQQVFRLVSKTE